METQIRCSAQYFHAPPVLLNIDESYNDVGIKHDKNILYIKIYFINCMVFFNSVCSCAAYFRVDYETWLQMKLEGNYINK